MSNKINENKEISIWILDNGLSSFFNEAEIHYSRLFYSWLFMELAMNFVEILWLQFFWIYLYINRFFSSFPLIALTSIKRSSEKKKITSILVIKKINQ